MNAETLKQAIARLHEELSRSSQLDAHSRQLLQQIMNKVDALEALPQSASAAPREHRLEQLAIGFEAEHPTLAAGLREFIDLLAKAGI